MKLSSSKVIYRQFTIGIVLFCLGILNIFYNWNYFKSYSGLKSTGYYTAYGIWYVTGYGLLAIITILICSGISKFKKNYC